MERFEINATYTYSGIIEAPTAEIAETLFITDLNNHYESTEVFEITPLEVGDE